MIAAPPILTRCSCSRKSCATSASPWGRFTSAPSTTREWCACWRALRPSTHPCPHHFALLPHAFIARTPTFRRPRTTCPTDRCSPWHIYTSLHALYALQRLCPQKYTCNHAHTTVTLGGETGCGAFLAARAAHGARRNTGHQRAASGACACA